MRPAQRVRAGLTGVAAAPAAVVLPHRAGDRRLGRLRAVPELCTYFKELPPASHAATAVCRRACSGILRRSAFCSAA
jgi:hypothetical protein